MQDVSGLQQAYASAAHSPQRAGAVHLCAHTQLPSRITALCNVPAGLPLDDASSSLVADSNSSKAISGSEPSGNGSTSNANQLDATRGPTCSSSGWPEALLVATGDGSIHVCDWSGNGACIDGRRASEGLAACRDHCWCFNAQ